jgi:TRAP-type C4-dicarboxylate transport system substrate-binding protein
MRQVDAKPEACRSASPVWGIHMRLAVSVWLVTLAMTPFTAPSLAQDTLKLSHFLGPTSFFEVDFAQPWARELEAKTGGKVKVEIYNGASPFGEVTKQATQVSDGTIDIALGLRGAEGNRFPRSSIIELPFVVQDAQSGSRALWKLYNDGALGDEYRDYKVLALFVHNPGLIHTTAKRITGPADLQGMRLRAPNRTVAVALESIGAIPAVLQVNDVMPAVKAGKIDGIVTNWGNPLPGFNDYMKFHTDIAFYTSAFFVVMNRQRFASLPVDVRAAIDELSNDALVERFGQLWNQWDKPVRDGAAGPGHEVIVPDAAVRAQWRAALQPATDRYLDGLVSSGFADAHATYDRLSASAPR